MPFLKLSIFSMSFFSFISLGLFFALSSCQAVPNNPPTVRKAQEPIINKTTRNKNSTKDEDEDDLTSRSNTNCSRYSKSDEVSVKDLDFIDANNVGNYILNGRCDEKNSLVYVTVNGYKLSNNPKCDRGRWKVELKLTNIASEADSIFFEITHNEERICREVQVAFIGPRNYIPIQGLEDYYELGFYVMKYEAKLEGSGSNSIAVSKAGESPIGRVSYKEALTLCENNGSRYDLMENSQWQNIVRSIEKISENWSQGKTTPSDDNLLNCGVSRGFPKPASNNDNDDCAVSSCDSEWDENKRTHLLPSGHRIWDMCGNAGEIMKDRYRGNHGVFEGFIYELSRDLKDMFGPKRTYGSASDDRRSNNWNLGYANISRRNDLIVRGMPGRDAGIFSVDVTEEQNSNRGYAGDIGFRCVYNP